MLCDVAIVTIKFETYVYTLQIRCVTKIKESTLKHNCNTHYNLTAVDIFVQPKDTIVNNNNAHTLLQRPIFCIFI